MLTARSALFVLGILLVASGLFLPVAWLLATLDPQASGEHLDKLRIGAWLFKVLLVVHGAVLLWAGRAGPASALHAPQAALWQPPGGDDALETPSRAGLVFLALVIAAIALRFLGLQQGLWLDEVHTLVDSVRMPLGRILTTYASDNTHLLYSILAHVSIDLFGESAATLRAPAILFGLASLWASYRLTRLVAAPSEALLVVALLAFSYHHVWFSQNARGYTGLLLATVLATDLLLRALWRGRTGQWISYASVIAMGMMVHLSMIFVVAAHFLFVVVLFLVSGERSPGRWRPLAALVLAGTLTMQVYAFVLPQIVAYFLQPAGGTTTAEVSWKSPVWLVNETIRGLDVGLAFGWIGLIGAGVVFATGFWSYLLRARSATLCFVLPAVLGGAALVVLGRNLWPRFFFNELTFAAMFAVRGARVIGETTQGLLTRAARPAGPAARTGWHLGTILAVGLILASALTLPRAYRYPKQDFAGARDFVARNQKPGDRAVALDEAAIIYSSYFAPDMRVAHSLAELDAQRAPDGHTWVLYTFGHYIAASNPELWQSVITQYEEIRAFPGTLGGGEIVVRRSLEEKAESDPSEPTDPDLASTRRGDLDGL